jgi:drug/metabolite transporter (DMT)-like permease
MSTRRANLKAGAIMLLAVLSFAVMDACLKVLAGAYPAMQVTALRALGSLPFVAAWISLTGGFGEVRHARFGMHVLRAGLGILMLAAFVEGVGRLPLSTAYAIFFAAPLLITAFAVPFLGERVEPARWVAIAVGMAGVLIALRPTASGAATWPGLALLVAATCYALSAITVRVLGRTDSTKTMMFWLVAFMAMGSGLLALPQWRPVEGRHAWVILAIAITGSLGQWAITEAFRTGEASFVAPFEYTALGWGMGLDWLFWQVAPELTALGGAALAIAGGVYLVRREHRRRDDDEIPQADPTPVG